MPELGIGLGITKGVTPKSKLLLDKYDIDAAFSLRKVRADYNGPCVRVRNSSGDFADIGFLPSGALDIDALNAHCGDNDGTVQTWYNQSTEGGRFNAVQDTTADQPIIYDASAGGYLGYVENTGNMYLRFENQLAGVTDTAIVYEHVTNTDHPFLLGSEDESVNYGIVVNRNVSGVDGFALQAGSGQTISTHTGDTIGEKFASFIYTGGTDNFISVNGYVSGEAAVTDSIDLDLIFTRDIASGGSEDNNDFVGKIWEVFLSTSDLSANRIALENSILSANGLTVPEQTLLEKYGSEAAAFSLRCLNRSYVGPIINLDAATTTPSNNDIYLNSSGEINTDRIEALCTNPDTTTSYGYCKKWYDQSGQGLDATASSSNAEKPIIFNGVSGSVYLSNGKPALFFNDGDVDMTTGSIPSNKGTSYVVFQPEITSPQGDTFMFARGGSNWYLTGTPGSSSAAMAPGEGTVSVNSATDIDPSTGRGDLYSATEAKVSLVVVDDYLQTSGQAWVISGYADNSFDIEGYVQEWVWWKDSLTSSIPNIEEIVNAHYLIYQEATASPSSGILSEYTDPVIAFSVRQLGDANLCMRVRRSSDNAEKNFGFASDGFVDTAAVESFCGSGDGFVSCLFGQHPSCPDARQSDTSEQPKVVSSGEFIMNNGYPSIQSVGDTSVLDYDGVSVGPNAFHILLAGPASDWGQPGYLTLRNNNSIRYDLPGNVNTFNFSGVTVLNQQNLVTASRVGGSISLFKNGEAAVQNPITGLDSEDVVSHTQIMGSWDDGHFQENIVWNKDLDSSRFDIQQNVHDAFDTFPLEDADTTHESGFLNEFSGAAAAYSVRKLGDSPVAMRVRKTVSSVDYYQVIGFDADGDLDTAAIEEFGGSNDVFVQTWYDQSGNGRHATQDTNAEQPKIYDGTDGIFYENDKPSIDFDGTDDYFDLNVFGFDDISTFEVLSTTDSQWIGLGQEGVGYSTAYSSSSSSTDIYAQYGTDPSLYVNSSLIATGNDGTTRAEAHDASSDGNQKVISIVAGSTANWSDSKWSGFASWYFDGSLQELIIYDSDQTSNRSDIENNINNYYLTYQEATASPATGLLSEAPGAKVAFSTRQLGDALLCMKVVSDATGNPTKNIGFKNGELDTAAIEAFCGTNIGRVETWYDQSGNGNHLTPIESNRPWVTINGDATAFGDTVGSGDKPIVFMPDGTASAANYQFSQGFVRIGGKPAIKFRSRLMATESLGDQMVSAFSVLKHSGSNSQFVYYLNPYAYLSVAGPETANFQHEGYAVQSQRGHIGGNGSFIDQEFDNSSLYVGVTNDSLEINNKDVIISHIGNEPPNASTSDFMVMGGRFVDSNSINASQPVVAEFIGYTDSVDFDATRAIVETNMNTRHKIFKKFSSGLLDQYPEAVGAYSLRRLSSTYTGPLIRVRDTESGSSEHDIYPNGEGDLEINQIYIASANRHQDANSGVSVVKWYDQSGNGNDLTVDLANAPQIKVSGEPVSRDGLRPAIEFDSSSYLSSEVITNTGEATAYVVANADDTALNKAIFFVPEVFAYLTSTEILTLYSGITPETPSGVVATIETNDTLVKNLIFFGNDGSTTFGGVNGQAFVTQANVPNSDSGYDKIKIGANATNTINFDGTIQEAVYYNSDQRSVRAGIEKNVNEYYEVFDEPLLDVVPDASAAYSLRKLRADYTGPAINVYNGTDYKDIYFKADGSLDTGAISRFCGSNDGTVAIWYDQSGNNRNATWVNSGASTKIYDGTSGLVTDNGRPAIDPRGYGFNAGAFTYDMSDGATLSTVFFAETADDNQNLGIIGSYGGNNQFLILDAFVEASDPGNFRTRVGGGGTAVSADVTFDNDPAVRTNIVFHVSDAATQDVNLYINGTTAASGTTSNAGTIIVNGIFGIDPNSYNIATGTIQEMILWESEKDKDLVQANTNRYYSIY